MPIPFTVTNALHMCWGLTLKFSSDSLQQELGKEYLSKIMENVNSIAGIRKSFLAELGMILARTTRNLGLIRLASIRHLEREAREYRDLKELLTSISELSFSKESIPLKIVSFLGFGGGIPALLDLNPFKETLESLKTAGEILNETKGAIDVKQINELIQRIFEFNQFTLSVEQIILFVLFGSIGIFVGSILFKVFALYHLNHKEKDLKKNQEKYWKDQYLMHMRDTLFFFQNDIKMLMYRFYRYTGSPEDPVMAPGLNVKNYIMEKILPNVNIDWDIWLPSQEETTPPKNTD
jgi:hypothetical protein